MVVIGSGPNGLAAANVLARRGFRVLVLEANPRRAGGALGTEALTLPGFRHDVGGGFFPFGATSPVFQALDLPGAGVEWLHARYQSCHPAVDGSFACIARGDAIETAPFGSARDAETFRALARFHAGIERHLLAALLGPFPSVGPLARIGIGPLLKIAGMFLRSTRGLATRLFETEAARRVLPGLGLHVEGGPGVHAGGHRDDRRLRLPERGRAAPHRRARRPTGGARRRGPAGRARHPRDRSGRARVGGRARGRDGDRGPSRGRRRHVAGHAAALDGRRP
jgi:phytoene dehydrogenase-like protein